MHVRHRVYLADLGRWTRRDPAGYVDGMNVYAYVGAMPVVKVDPMGLVDCRPDGCGPLDVVPGGSSNASPSIGGALDDVWDGIQRLIDRVWDLLDQLPDPRNPDPCGICEDNQIPDDVPLPNFGPDTKTSNGCGVGSLDDWLDGNIPFGLNDLFTPCCNQHDECYTTCNEEISDCDREFEQCLYNVCDDLPSDLLFGEGTCDFFASQYVTVVEAIGGEYFCDAQRKVCNCVQL
jgi:hypothetical protein